MKKICTLFLCLCICGIAENAYCDTNNLPLQSTYENKNLVKQSTKKNKKYELDLTFDIKKKNNDLVKIPSIIQINNQSYKNKTTNDNLEYQKYKKQLPEEEYQIYVIFDKLLRASNLQYQNWKIGINIDPEIVNASALVSNLITINPALYESLYQNDDALAFVIAHELAHLILGHNQVFLDNNLKISELENQIQSLKSPFDQRQNPIKKSSSANNYEIVSNSISCFTYETAITSFNLFVNKVYAQERQLEIDADIEAITLMTKAGYNPYKINETLNLWKNDPNIYTNRTTHSLIKKRQEKIEDTLDAIDIENIKNVGKQNLYKSKPIICKKTATKDILILENTKGFTKYKYIADTKEDKLIKKAYLYYQNNNFDMSKKYFLKANLLNKKNYIPPLYLSYIEEYDFKVNKYKKSLKNAKYWANKAYSLNPNDKYVLKQKKDIAEIYNILKIAKNNN